MNRALIRTKELLMIALIFLHIVVQQLPVYFVRFLSSTHWLAHRYIYEKDADRSVSSCFRFASFLHSLPGVAKVPSNGRGQHGGG